MKEMDNTKLCKNCKETYPLSLEYFYKQKGGRDGLRSYCKNCAKLKGKQGRVKYAVKRKESIKKWKTLNPDKLKKYAHDNYVKYKDIIKLKTALRYQKNKDVYNKYRKQWRRENPDKVLAQLKRARKAHPGRASVWSKTRSNRKRATGGFCSEAEWNLLCDLCENKCLYCKQLCVLTVDHIIPVVYNGDSFIDNLQPLCRSCNSKKNDTIIDYRIQIKNKEKFLELIGKY